jgi:alkyl hydroperoxide reductase subunit AhpF
MKFIALKIEGGGFKPLATSGSYEGRSVIMATGVKHRHLNIEGEDKYLGHGVSYCAVCDGPFYAGKDVMVIGDANSALQYAILLAAQCPHVDVVTLFDKFFADDVLVKGLKSLQNVTITHNMSSLSFNGDGKNLTSVSFKTPSRKKRKTSRPRPPSSRLANSPTTSVSLRLSSLKKASSSPTNRWRRKRQASSLAAIAATRRSAS